MNILALDFSWFTTIPGILISCGVVLLIIALIIFIISSVKGKKEVKVENVEGGVNAPVSEMPQVFTPGPEVVPVEPVGFAPVTPEVPTEATFDFGTTTVDPVAPAEPISFNTPVVEEMPQQVVPEVFTAPTFEPVTVTAPVETMPSVAQGIPTETIIEPTIPVMDSVVSPMMTEPVIETPVAPNLDTTQVSVYGGVNPVEAVVTPEEVKPMIYGGNDPLEATQKIPLVEEHHAPYGGVNVVEPTPTPVSIPTMEPVAPMPVQPTPVVVTPPVAPVAPAISNSVEEL